MEKVKNFLHLRSISSKIILAFVICGLLLLGAVELIVTENLRTLEEDLVSEKERTDIQYMEDYISSGSWRVEDGMLYKGDVAIGDGTEEHANSDIFVELEGKTGTFFYTFIYAPLADPGIKAEIDARIPVQTSYLRTAGSTRNAEGESIVGTYMDSAVASVLGKSDVYSGDANVEGRQIYCLYKVLYDEQGSRVGAIVVGRSTEELAARISKANKRAFAVIIIALVLVTVGMMVIISRWLKALNKAKKYLSEIGTGIFPDEPIELHTKDEMEEMAKSINAMTDSLREKERIGAELSLATDIQANMLPRIFPPFPEHDEFDIYASMHPAKEVGGDFYDFFMLDDKNLAVVVADVSGKGVPAALFMVIAKTLIKNHTQSGLRPCDVFTKVNQMLCEGNRAGLFVTAWMGVLDIETGKLTYVNAGHNPPMIKLGDKGFEFLRARPGFVLAGMEAVRYKQAELFMQPGDKLFLYTDGVTEATNVSNELYGEARLSEYLNSNADDSVDTLLYGLRANIKRFVGKAEQFDDITMLVLNYRKYKGDSGMIEREYEASDALLDEVLGFVEGELDKLGCPPGPAMQITVAVEEIFVNIAHYAYAGYGVTGKMKLGLRPEPDGGVTLRFSDRGMPFDPLSKADPDISLSAEDREIGGLGIYMVKKTMDEASYKYENGQNVLTLRKNF